MPYPGPYVSSDLAPSTERTLDPPPPFQQLVMASEGHPLELLRVGNELIENFRSKRAAGYEVMGDERHHHRFFSSPLIESIKCRLQRAQREFRGVGVPSGVTRGWVGRARYVDTEGCVTVISKGNLQELTTVSLDNIGQVIIPRAAVPCKISVLQNQVYGVVARKAGAPALNVLAQQVLEHGDGLFYETKLNVRWEIAHHFVRVGMAGDTMAGLADSSGDFRILLQRRPANEPGPPHSVLF